jgi:hypothetical protein
MKISLHASVPSPELTLLTECLADHHVQTVYPWDLEAFTKQWDISISVGISNSIPAKRKILFMLGPTRLYKSNDWQDVITTSDKAFRSSVMTFLGASIHKVEVPIRGLQKAKNRIVEPNKVILHCAPDFRASISSLRSVVRLGMWCRAGDKMFRTYDFNSYVKGGAIGVYPEDDGYDLQVRRHLAMGSPVFCNRDFEVIGELADVCGDLDKISFNGLQKPIDCCGSEDKFKEQIKSIIER